MHENNCFLTLTYSSEKLESPKLQYEHAQKFIKDLRTKIFTQTLERLYPNETQKIQRSLFDSETKELRTRILDSIRISTFVTGEYGDLGKRPHWHYLIFNYRPNDCRLVRQTDLGHSVFKSDLLDSIWDRGITEIGEITFESAGYCARYAAKKLVHGPDGTHDFDPISKRSCKNAIGKSWIEKYYLDVFQRGYINLPNGSKCSIPRYYERWLKKNHPDFWVQYITTTKTLQSEAAFKKNETIMLHNNSINRKRSGLKGPQITRDFARNAILEQKFQGLQQNLKL